MIFRFIIILIFATTGCISAQSIKSSKIMRHVDSVSNGLNKSFETLTLDIVKNEWNEKEKAYALFYWIAKNITYDYDGLKTGYWVNYPSDYKIAQDTYEKRKGVCSGYSHLFNLMCVQAGLKSIVIDGYSRIETYQAGLPISEPNHAWNAVCIEGTWKLLDVTWASSTAKDDSINDYYFSTNPEEFAVNHFPENEEWQLLQVPIDKKDFDTYPYISPSYFELGFDKNYPKDGLLKSNAGTYKITVGVPGNYDLLVKVYDYNNKEWITDCYSAHNKCDNTIIKVELEDKGQYLVKVSALNQGESNFKIFEGVLYYTLLYE